MAATVGAPGREETTSARLNGKEIPLRDGMTGSLQGLEFKRPIVRKP
ncbi:MAG: hypothetical protein K9M82_07820 [Deltaproteobacteria bacterium]|nr:hypothetical protein [Deltaproteobacteria bacterium]